MTPDVLVFNTGSSSVKVSLFVGGQRRLGGSVEGIGSRPRAVLKGAAKEVLHEQRWPDGDGPADHDAAIGLVVQWLADRGMRPGAVGHRVVHGGTRFSGPVRVDPPTRDAIAALVPLDPLHQPYCLAGLDAATRAYPGVPQVACFDTSFHQTRPWVAQTFALPRRYFDEGVRRYGFHGLSYAWIAQEMRRIDAKVAAGRVVVCHLGNGCSLCAMKDGKSVETTMGFSVLDGVPMGTRCGQLDPGVVLHLLTDRKMSVEDVSDLLYRQSGLLGLSGLSNDVRDLLASGVPAAKEALEYFVYRIVREIGSLGAALGGLDGVVFTAGIGENSAVLRERMGAGLAWLGLDLDASANAGGGPRITSASSRVSAWVVPTDEEQMIAREVVAVLQ